MKLSINEIIKQLRVVEEKLNSAEEKIQHHKDSAEYHKNKSREKQLKINKLEALIKDSTRPTTERYFIIKDIEK